MAIQIAPGTTPRYDLMGTQMGYDPLALGFQFPRVFPFLSSPLVAGALWRHSVQSAMTTLPMGGTIRAATGGTSESDIELVQDTFALKEYAHKVGNPAVTSAQLGLLGTDDLTCAVQAATVVARDIEMTAASFLSSTYFTTAAAGTVWSNGASDPIKNVNDNRLALKNQCGVDANAMAIPESAAWALSNHSAIRDRFKGVSTDFVPTKMREDILSQIFSLEVIILGASKNTAAKGATAASLSSIWTATQALLFVKETGSHMPVQMGRTIALTSEYASPGASSLGEVPVSDLNCAIDEYPSADNKTNYIRATRTVQIKPFLDSVSGKCPAGILITGVM